MKYRIRHEIRGRIRLHMEQRRMTCKEADTLLYFLETLPGVTSARGYEQTGDAVVCYSGEREDILRALRSFQYRNVHVPDNVLENSGRALSGSRSKADDLWRQWQRPIPLCLIRQAR